MSLPATRYKILISRDLAVTTGASISGANTGDQTISDATISTTDITTNNFTTAKHGFVPKGTNIGNFLKDDGTWAAGVAIPAKGRSTAQTAAVSSVAAYTVGAADASFMISANANVTAFAVGTFNVQATYTDETNTPRTLTLSFSSLTGTIGIAIAATGPFEGIPAHIRAKAGTVITILTSGTFTSLTYNVEGYITQIG